MCNFEHALLRRLKPGETFSGKGNSKSADSMKFSHSDTRLERAVRQHTGLNFFISLNLNGRSELPMRSYNIACSWRFRKKRLFDAFVYRLNYYERLRYTQIVFN
jgi:hypothetical protein